MKILPLILVFLCTSCTLEPKTYDAPSDLISQDSMVIIMHDMSIMESFIHQKYIQLERYALLMRVSGDSLLNDFGLTRKRYEVSMEYYGKNPALFMQIYDSVLFRLEGEKPGVNPYEALDRFGNN